MAIQEGIAYWASVTTPNTKFEPVYTVDLVVEDSVADDFETRGFKIKSIELGDEKVGRALTFKRKVNGPNGMVRNFSDTGPALEKRLPNIHVIGN